MNPHSVNRRALRQAINRSVASATWGNSDWENRVFARAAGEPVAMSRSAAEQWQILVDEIMERQGIDRSAALRIARAERPDLLAAMREQANTKDGRR